MHYFGIITTLLPFSKYASPNIAHRKPNGRLRLLVDLRKINNLISVDYINNNEPVSTLTDTPQNLAGKKLFCKLHCSQAYHVNNRSEVSPTSRLQRRQQDVCLHQTGPRAEPLIVIVLQLYEGVSGQSHKGG